jgi:hypothetical protein
MDEVRIVRKRTHVWPVVIAVVILALVIAFVLFMNRGADSTRDLGWNGVIEWPIEAAPGGGYGIA